VHDHNTSVTMRDHDTSTISRLITMTMTLARSFSYVMCGVGSLVVRTLNQKVVGSKSNTGRGGRRCVLGKVLNPSKRVPSYSQ
jgi:hypothetical protein